jgi:hypothetical protein
MATAIDSFPSFASSGSSASASAWTLYFHDPEDTDWTQASYKVIGSFTNFTDLWATFARISETKFLTGMFFMMRDPYPPLWENRVNIRGGSYSIKVPEKSAYETYCRYVAAGIMQMIGKDKANNIMGVSISPKKGFHILKLWNVDARSFNATADVAIYGDGMILSDIIYRPHVDQKM